MIKPLGPAQSDTILDLDQWTFGMDLEGLDPALALAPFEWDRTFGAWLEGPHRLAGMNSTFSFTLTVPGASVPAAGLTWVGVHPRDRRQGLLRAMMGHHLDQVRRGPEPVSVLFAAEPGIYGRFGYGLATRTAVLSLSRGAALRPVAGSDAITVEFERIDPERHSALIREVHDQAYRSRPGSVSRPNPAHTSLLLYDPPSRRQGAEELRILVARDAGGRARGYVLFRRANRWGMRGPEGKVTVRELSALDGPATHALWRILLDLDLTTEVESGSRPVDDALFHLLVDVRAVEPRVHDGLWLRIVDLPAALAARRYPVPLDVVLEVSDAQCPANAGRWHLVAGPDHATCIATTAEPQLRLDVRELGSAYLGGESLAAMGRAGLVEELRPGALDTTAAAFGWPVAPFSGWVF